jgi:hypothetical protein
VDEEELWSRSLTKDVHHARPPSINFQDLCIESPPAVEPFA